MKFQTNKAFLEYLPLIIRLAALFLAFFLLFSRVPAVKAVEDLPAQTAQTTFSANLCPQADRSSCQEVVANRESLPLPDLRTLPPHDFRLEVSGGGDRRIIRFSNSVANVGKGVLEVSGQFNPRNNVVEVVQNLYRSDGTISAREVGDFMFHAEHGHWHWEDFSVYEIWTVDERGSLVEAALDSGKVGYCMIDINRIEDDALPGGAVERLPASDRAQYTSCGWRRQGISVGWVDIYDWNTPGQVMDVSHLDDGLYALISMVDPSGILIESDERNNAAGVYFYLRGDQFFYLREVPLDFLPEAPGD